MSVHERGYEQLLDLQKMMNETLYPELEECLGYLPSLGGLGKVLRHPLVYQVPFYNAGLANRLYDQKIEALARAQAEEAWSSVVFLYERAYRTQALIDHVVGRDENGEPLPLMGTSQQIRDLAAHVWTDSENLQEHESDWAAMFAGAEGLLLGDAEEFAQLPDPVRIYRGDIDDGGWSWSTERTVAEFFAKRFGDNSPLVTALANKCDVFGYLTSRSEFEILVESGNVKEQTPCLDQPSATP